ncbi:MAG TPA: biotin--[acetyl-CoA-carboxylase] ligase [Erysipelotrichaceae bacterium]|nr:biotin--[acetyl-CoA-carboxylase] ligase [Erysipelotrichaceae bacterium]
MSIPMAHEIRRFDVLDSTNDYCFRAQEELRSGSVVMASYQTQGKGTQGRKWSSDRDENLLFSILYKDESFTSSPLFSHRVALAIVFALREYGLTPQIKWPNDILVDHRKIAGILIETSGGSCVVGIGINVNQTKFPQDLRMPATSLIQQVKQRHEPLALLLKVLDALDEVLTLDDETLLVNYKAVLYQLGLPCVVKQKEDTVVATITDIDFDGSLIATDIDRNKIKIHSKAMIDIE